MRRRAASNNPKRVPKSMREAHIYSMAKSEKNKKKKKDKKVKKRKSKKVGTRNKDPKRTVLHLWLAKRFKLVLEYDLHLPYRNNVKNQRLLYRCAKKGYAIFYLPQFKSMLLDFSRTTKEACLEALKPFIRFDQEKLSNLQLNHCCEVHLYDLAQHFLGPIRCLWLEDGKHLWLTAHISIFDKVQQLLKELSSSHSIPIVPSNQHSFIRMYGPNAVKHLVKKFSINRQALLNLPSNQARAFTATKEETKTITPFTFVSTNFTNKSELSLCIIGNALGHLGAIDLVVPNEQVKPFWHKLNENMSQLVGGQRDEQFFAIETCTPLFPSLGYADVRGELDIIRDPCALQQLTDNNFQAVDANRTSYVTVFIDYLSGKYIDGDKIASAIGPEEINNKQHKDIIGLVEFGCYSMHAAHVRAIGYVTLEGLQTLAHKQKEVVQENGKEKRLSCFVRSKFARHHPALLSIAHPNS